MKKMASAIVVGFLAIGLAACSPTAEKQSYQRLKCPACGYQFTTPAD